MNTETELETKLKLTSINYYEKIKPLSNKFKKKINSYLILENFYTFLCKILSQEGLITKEGLMSEIKKEYFADSLEYLCSNPSCSSSESKILSRDVLKNCPRCKSPLELLNYDKLRMTFEFNLVGLTIYLLTGEKKTTYLIKYPNGVKTIKSGNDSLKDELFYYLKDKKINFNFLKINRKGLNLQNLIYDYITLECRNIVRVYDVGFIPRLEEIYERDNKKYINLYEGNKYLNLILSEEEKTKFKNIDLEKECPSIFFLLNNLVNKDKEGLDYLIKYLSFVLNNPHRRTEKLISFYGEENSGKGTFFNDILNVLFKGYCISINMKDLVNSNFNEFYSKKLFVFVDESKYSKEIEQLMLNYITEKSIIINNKHGSKKEEEVFFNYVCASNREIPMKVGERRSIYFRSKSLGDTPEKSAEIGEKLSFKISEEIDLFANYLKSLEVDFITINKGYNNRDKKDVLEATKSTEQRFIDDLFSYNTLEDFVTCTLNENIGHYIKDNFIEYELFLRCFNKFRFDQGIKSSIALNKFNWFCHKLNIDKDDNTQFTRKLNNSKKKVMYINLDLINKFFENGNKKKERV